MKVLSETWNEESQFKMVVIKRVGDLAIASKSYYPSINGGRTVGYEIAHIQSHGELSMRKDALGNPIITPAAEYWPGQSEWGKKAWSATTFEKAEQIMERELAIINWIANNPTVMSNLDSAGNPRLDRDGNPVPKKECPSTRTHAIYYGSIAQ